jgi:hypothetical protein
MSEQQEPRELEFDAEGVADAVYTSIERFYSKFPGSRAEPPVCMFNEHELCLAAIGICDLFGVDDDDFDADAVCEAVTHVLEAASRRPA